MFSTTQTDAHATEIAELIAPQGRFGLIDNLENANQFKAKSVSIHWELMYTRSMFATAARSSTVRWSVSLPCARKAFRIESSKRGRP